MRAERRSERHRVIWPLGAPECRHGNPGSPQLKRSVAGASRLEHASQVELLRCVQCTSRFSHSLPAIPRPLLSAARRTRAQGWWCRCLVL